MEKARQDFLKAVKTARDQLAFIIELVQNRYGSKQLPPILKSGIEELYIVVIHSIGYQVRASVVYHIGGNIFAVSEVGLEYLPDCIEQLNNALGMCELMLRLKV